MQKEYDIERDTEIEKYGIKVIRFSNEEVNTNIETIVSKIKDYINNSLGPSGN